MEKMSFLLFMLSGLVVVFGLGISKEASARMWDSTECQPGFYFKKGGWTHSGYYKSGGYCIPMHVRWTK